jgi:hypothetical protein
LKEENNIIYTEDDTETEMTEGIYGKFGSNSYQVDLLFVRTRGNITKLFFYLKRCDGKWKDKMNKLYEKSDDLGKNGYKLMRRKLERYMPEDMFRRRIEIAKKRWKKNYKFLMKWKNPKDEHKRNFKYTNSYIQYIRKKTKK